MVGVRVNQTQHKKQCPVGRMFVVLILAWPAAAQSVQENFRVWAAYFGDHPFTDLWGLHMEAHVRRQDGLTRWQQLLIRPGVNFRVNRFLTVTAGWALNRTYPTPGSAGGPTNEHRLWQQAWLRYSTGKVAWSSRFRFENRFLPVAGGYRFENRLRYWQQATVPIKRQWYVTRYDEAWFYVAPYQSGSAFDQNRAYAALGFSIKPDWRIETGYLNQTLLERTGRVLEVNHMIVISIYGTAPLRKRKTDAPVRQAVRQ
jgi:hypothetical protein